MDSSNDQEEDEADVYCRHLLFCRTVWLDATRTDDGFSLGKSLIQLGPADGGEYPLVLDRIFACAQLHGRSGEQTVRLRLVRIPDDEDDEGIQLGKAGAPREYGPWDIELIGEEFVESFAFPVVRVRFDDPGVYEFQLRLDSLPTPVGRERLLLRRVPHDDN